MKIETYAFSTFAVMGVATYLTRSLSFIFLGKHQDNPRLNFVGRYLPPAVMVTLVIYCLKSVDFGAYPHGLLEGIGMSTVAVLHVFRRNAMLSIFGGTGLYLALLHLV